MIRRNCTITSAIVLLLLAFGFQPKAQLEPDRQQFAESEMARLGGLSTLQATGIGSDYDVKYYRLSLRINPDTTVRYVQGSVTTYFTTLQAGFNLIKFDFKNNMTIDSVRYNGAKLPTGNIVKDVDTLEITLSRTLATNYFDSISIYYKGSPALVAGFSNGTGYVKTTHNAGADNYIYTLSEPYSAFTWWPCKNDVTDKADSVDLIINTPTGFKAAGNGTLVSETTIGSNVIAVWQERYAIPAYLVCTAVANYVVYNSPSVVIGGTTMPVYHYIFPEHNTAAAHTALDGVNAMLTAFSTYFGDYAFKNEKYGHYEFGFSGGMEHITFSGMNFSTFNAVTDWDVIAHELGHQWFGDKVTCGTWGDIWVNEGFAQWSEIIAAEKIPALNSNLVAHRLLTKNNAKSLTAETTFRTNTSDILSIFTPAVYIYERGAMILNMLRLLLGDTKFWQAIQNYTSDPVLAYKNSVTDDVERHMENVSGIDLTEFFDQWIYNKSYPTYTIQWAQKSKRITFQLVQSMASATTATYFNIPLSIRIQGALGPQDTTVIIYDKQGIMNFVNNGVVTSAGSNKIAYNLSFVPITITFDQNNLSLATATISTNALLPVHVLQLSGNKSGAAVALGWKAEWTGKANQFEIQRSVDGKTFVTIGKMEVNETQNGRYFSYSDNNFTEGNNFYRIRMIMADDDDSYSNIVRILTANRNSLIVVAPNPVSDRLNINFDHTLSLSGANLYIFDMQGKIMFKADGKSFSSDKLQIDTRTWPTGFYNVDLNIDGEVVHQKILVKH